MPRKNFHSARQLDPTAFDKIVTLKVLPNGVHVLGGKLKGGNTTKEQSYLFPKDKFTPEQAKKWLKEHDKKSMVEKSDSVTLDIEETERIDYQVKIGKVSHTDEGFLQGSAAVAKVGILTYVLGDGSIRREFVSEETLFDQESMDSLKMKPVTNQHPKEVLLDSQTVKQRKVGMTGETVEREGDFLKTSLVITDQDAIDSVQQGTKELSPGYRVTVLLQDGEYNGEKYDAVQLKRKYNHLATCDKARGGKDLCLNLDSNVKLDGYETTDFKINSNVAGNSTRKEKNMPTIKINNIDYEAAQEVINHIDSLLVQIKDLTTKIDSGKAKLDASSETHKALQTKYDELKKSLPTLVANLAEEKAKLDSACLVLLSKEEIAKLDGKPNSEIKLAVIAKKFPNIKLDGKPEGYIDGMFNATIETIESDKRGDTLANQRKNAHQHTIKGFVNHDDDYAEMVKRDNELWKKDPNEVTK